MVQNRANSGHSHEPGERRGVSPPCNQKGGELPGQAYAAPLARRYLLLNHARIIDETLFAARATQESRLYLGERQK